jgi:hypothetical protein
MGATFLIRRNLRIKKEKMAILPGGKPKKQGKETES